MECFPSFSPNETILRLAFPFLLHHLLLLVFRMREAADNRAVRPSYSMMEAKQDSSREVFQNRNAKVRKIMHF